MRTANDKARALLDIRRENGEYDKTGMIQMSVDPALVTDTVRDEESVLAESAYPIETDYAEFLSPGVRERYVATRGSR